jgi:hypothetical protein
MSRNTQISRRSLRLVVCGLVASAVAIPAAPAFAEPAPYQHDAGTAVAVTASEPAPYQHDGPTAGGAVRPEPAPYQHDGGTVEPRATPEPAPFQHDVGTGDAPMVVPIGDVDPVISEPSGFDWGTAGVTVAGMLGLLLLGTGAVMVARSSRRRAIRH